MTDGATVTETELPPEVAAWVGRSLDAGVGDVGCERGYVLHWLEAVEDANPLYWDDAVADELTGGRTAPPTMLSVWMRPLMFKPDGWTPTPDAPAPDEAIRPLEIHFRLKDALDLPDGVVSWNELEFHTPVRPGDTISTTQSVRNISTLKTTRLGTGRFWQIDVTYTNQRGEVVGVETYNMFGYQRKAA